MEVIKRTHQGYKEFEKAKKQGIEVPMLFDKYQYIYKSEKGEISLVLLKNYFKKGENFWEIYCLEGKLFQDVERFGTKKEAEKQIKKYLN